MFYSASTAVLGLEPDLGFLGTFADAREVSVVIQWLDLDVLRAIDSVYAAEGFLSPRFGGCDCTGLAASGVCGAAGGKAQFGTGMSGRCGVRRPAGRLAGSRRTVGWR